ncbi:hypothetical protein FRC07_006849 [Ceratobasidium sp. 392]|nr:hypothetical protein FRC07_006849 [Ceratobasidium sp. 392]
MSNSTARPMPKSKSQPALAPALSDNKAVDDPSSILDNTPKATKARRKQPLKYIAWAFVFGTVCFWHHEDLMLFLFHLYALVGLFVRHTFHHALGEFMMVFRLISMLVQVLFLYKVILTVIVCLFALLFEELKHSN